MKKQKKMIEKLSFKDLLFLEYYTKKPASSFLDAQLQQMRNSSITLALIKGDYQQIKDLRKYHWLEFKKNKFKEIENNMRPVKS